MGRKRRSTFKIASAVVEPLADLLQKHPELGYDTPTAAVTQAIVKFTNELRAELAEAQNPKGKTRADLEELLGFLRRLAIEAKSDEGEPPTGKRSR